jgi:four helix bundle protein
MLSERSPEPSIKSYRDLRVWQRAVDLIELIYRATEAFPGAERYGLVAQMRRAAVSVASNIAEGHARSRGDYIRFLVISAGSLTEIETQLFVSLRLGFIADPAAKSLLDHCAELGRMLSTLRRRVRASRAPRHALGPSP